MEYREAYNEASKWIENKEDENFQMVLETLSLTDKGTIRDRLADAMVYGAEKKSSFNEA